MFKIGKDNTIAKKVMDVVNSRITKAQEDYDIGCESIDKDASGRIAEIEVKREKDKDKLAEKLANNVLGSK